MTRLTASRPRRASLGLTLGLVLLAGACAAISLTRSDPAGAGTTGLSPGVYVSTGTALEQTTISGLGGPANPVYSGSAQSVGPVAINVTATLGVTRVSVDAAVAIPPVQIFQVPSNVQYGNITGIDPIAYAMSPADAATAYALTSAGSVYALPLVPGSHPAPAPLANLNPNGTSGFSCSAIAVRPDAATVVVGCTVGVNDVLYAVSTGTGAVTTWVQPYRDYTVADLTMSPDGSAVYVVAAGQAGTVAGGTSYVFRVPLPLNPKAPPTWRTTLSGTEGIARAVTVDRTGTNVYVGANSGPSTKPAVARLAASSGAVTGSGAVPLVTDANGGGGISSLALSPDGRTLLVAGATPNAAGGTTARVDSLDPGSLDVLGASPDLGGFTPPHQSIAVTPDQAPVADLSPASGTAGVPLTLNASSSNVAYGQIVSYRWTFGDGTAGVTTGSPFVSHVYNSACSPACTATVTETDSAGASLPPAPFVATAVNGPGTTPYIQASLLATISAPVVIVPPGHAPPPPPTTLPSHHTTPTTLHHGPPATVYHPAIKLVPTVGGPGTIVTVTGHGFPPNHQVKVTWSTNTATFTESTDGHGNLPAHKIDILTPDVLGARKANATTLGAPATAQANFLVVPNTAEPGGDRATFLFRSEGP